MELKRVVVTGIGAVTPLGNTAAETWQNMLKGVSGAAPITHFDASKFKAQFACEVKNFNPRFLMAAAISPRQSRSGPILAAQNVVTFESHIAKPS